MTRGGSYNRGRSSSVVCLQRESGGMGRDQGRSRVWGHGMIPPGVIEQRPWKIGDRVWVKRGSAAID